MSEPSPGDLVEIYINDSYQSFGKKIQEKPVVLVRKVRKYYNLEPYIEYHILKNGIVEKWSGNVWEFKKYCE